jgi:hypothetical protein
MKTVKSMKKIVEGLKNMVEILFKLPMIKLLMAAVEEGIENSAVEEGKEKENDKEKEEENGNEKSKETGNETEYEKVECMFTLIHIIYQLFMYY